MLYARPVQRFLLIGIAVALTAGCGTPQPILVRPAPPPPWTMQACQPWPALGGEGRVRLEDAAQAVRSAAVAHSDCQARHEGLMRYVTDVVQPE